MKTSYSGGEKTVEKKKIRIYVAHEESRSKIKEGLEKFDDVELTVQPLAVGDYVLSGRCCVESKASWDDFFKSVDDGRLWEQLALLKDTYERPLLLVVGVKYYDDRRGKTFIYRERCKAGAAEDYVAETEEERYKRRYKVDIHRHPDTVRGIEAAIEVGFCIPIHKANNIYDASKYLYRVAKREQIDEKRPSKIQLAKKRKMSIPELQRLTVESLGDGIGPTIAESLLCTLKTPEKIITASEEELQTAEGVGKDKARKIREVATTPYVPETEWKKEEK